MRKDYSTMDYNGRPGVIHSVGRPTTIFSKSYLSKLMYFETVHLDSTNSFGVPVFTIASDSITGPPTFVTPYIFGNQSPFDFCNAISVEGTPSFGVFQQPQAGVVTENLIQVQENPDECPICGDKVTGYHYRVRTCEACKGFFKRTVQKGSHYVCTKGERCEITKATRRHCSACRFAKCLACGMKVTSVRENRARGGRSAYESSSTYQSQLPSAVPQMQSFEKIYAFPNVTVVDDRNFHYFQL